MFENELSATWPAFLDHHRVFGTALVPSPAFLEMALAAGAQIDGPGAELAIERFEIREGLILADDAERTVQFVLRDDDGTATSRGFEVFSRADASDEWALHATGALTSRSPDSAPSDASLDVDDVSGSRCGEHIAGDDYYAQLAELGLEFGRSFRGVTGVWRRDGEALGRIELPADLAAEREQFGIHTRRCSTPVSTCSAHRWARSKNRPTC